MELNEMPIEQLELSVRSTNALRRSKIDVAGDLMALTTEQLYAIRNLGEKSVTENLEKIDELKSGRFSARSKLPASTKQLSSQKPEASVGNPNEPGHSAGGGDAEMTIFDMIQMTEYRDQILANARKHDFPLEERLYSTRAINRLRGKGYHKISEILFLSHDDLMEIKSLGTKSVQEIEDAVRIYLIENEERLRSDCSGTEPMAENEAADKAVNYDALPQMILNLYQGNEFRGYSLKEMKDALALPEAADDNRIKKAIGSLLADRELEYVDFRCYRIYEPFAEELDRCDQIDDRGKRILHGRLEGKTLESISGEFDLTRERVRQLVNKNARIVSAFHLKRTGKRCFDEDYYRYFYENYAIEKKDAIEWLGIPEPVFRYFDMIGAAGGSKDLNRAMEDHTGLDAGLRMKINNYLNRDKVYVDGVWIRKSRAELERVAVRKLCGEQLSFKEFAKRYNAFLMEQDIDDEDLLITDAVYRTRLNRMADRRTARPEWNGA